MSANNQPITVFEHDTIRTNVGENCITDEQFKALKIYYAKNSNYYRLEHNGVKFNQFVGVIQVGKTLIEVLPKTDKYDTDKSKWRNILIGMLRAAGNFDIKSTSSSKLKIKPNTILDLYFELFINEIEYLVHGGLVKQYRKKESNLHALKGSIQFGKQIQQNLTHEERFYVKHTTYDIEHLLHFIIYKTIRLLQHLNTNSALQSRIGNLMLNFPEMPDIKITETTFNKLVFNRKTQSYKKAIEIAKLILLQYHPDLSQGRNDVLALMFDMNKLWEKFVFRTLQKNISSGFKVTSQISKDFWKPEIGKASTIKADILLSKGSENFVLDTKWKTLLDKNPSAGDLHQMFVYQEFYDAKKVALLYPDNESSELRGHFVHSSTNNAKECGIFRFVVPSEGINNQNLIKTWQQQINETIAKWIS